MKVEDENRTGGEKWYKVTGAKGGGRLRSGRRYLSRYIGSDRRSGILLSPIGKAERTKLCGCVG